MPGPLFKTALTKTAAQGRKQQCWKLCSFYGWRDYLGTHLSFGSVLEPELVSFVAIPPIPVFQLPGAQTNLPLAAPGEKGCPG